MASRHVIEYAKSGRAKCHGPCGHQLIGKGELRYGSLVVDNRFGESHHWFHWRCVPKKVLQRLKGLNMTAVQGWHSISPADQQHVRDNVARGQASYSVAPAAVAAAPGPSTPGPSTQKRKRESEIIEIPDDDEEEEPIPVEEEVVEELYCSLKADIVGVQYYTGMVGNMEQVLVRREPNNAYDRNAIKVFNAANVGVGHLPRNVAAKLAPLMDAGRVTVEGRVLQGNIMRGMTYILPADIKIYGPSDQRAMLEDALKWATPGQRGFDDTMRTAEFTGNPARRSALPPPALPSAPSYAAQASSSQAASSSAAAKAVADAQRRYAEAQKAIELRTMLDSLSKVDDEGRRTGLLDALCGVDGEDGIDVLKLPELEPEELPLGLQADVELMKHQKQALKWCLAKEHPELPASESDKPVQFCAYKKQSGKPYYYNTLTHMPSSIEKPPVLGRGGLIADAMGLGKTLTVLALVLLTKSEPKTAGFSGATLIVCPLSVLSNWEKQIADHVQRGKLKTIVYYGPGRNTSVEELQKADVVITTYQVVTSDHGKAVAAAAGVEPGPSKKKRKTTDGGLTNVMWRRVVLDEGHQIRNPKTNAAIACRALKAERRWVVTGTPIINSPKDLGSILQFLGVCAPLDQEDYFKSLLDRPLKAGTAEGAQLLKSVMNQICLRRTKEMQDEAGKTLVELPPVEMVQVPVQLDPETRALYDVIEDLSRQRFEFWMENARRVHGQNAVAGANVLGMLTRMRQIVLHPGLIPRNYVETLREPDAAVEGEERVQQVTITPKEKARLQRHLAQAIEENEECPVCFEVLREPRITVCSHAFCLTCITEVIRRDTRCPMDRRTLGMQDLIEPPEPTDATQRWNGDADDMDEDGETMADEIRTGSSAKIDQLIKMLQLTPATEKSLVFSQFTGFLDKIGEALDAAGIAYVRLDGKMSAKRREEVIRQFSVPLRDKGKGKAKAVPDAGARARLAAALRSSSPARAPSPPPATAPVASPSTSKRPVRAAKAAKSAMVIPSSDDELDFDARVEAADDDDYVDDANGAPKDEHMSDNGGFFSDESEEDFKPSRFANKGKGRAGRSLLDALDRGLNPPVMLISLKAGALGLNLTVANNVYLMDPWWQEGIESQAIDRCNRIGQTKTVHVYQMVAENTIEQKVLEIQERKKNLIKQAFSGIKSRETERQKREARMNDLIELFGMRNREEQD
ncbi:hypothetical protein AURDEDRAFT_117185 [Auricularia subglabra TFB-10046 SS5]|uniref:Uncharacterized protein n=1 Tax=Auricularia subglabra (strain TFB-10046 / SS5) TaxID=717982 RepID=J0LFE4_AURST|nr:hypothetical protein AURDEDRAFT_117185 [Auricularia subglabra TFB-10046 SS5]